MEHDLWAMFLTHLADVICIADISDHRVHATGNARIGKKVDCGWWL
jgi:hypothetical protein